MNGSHSSILSRRSSTTVCSATTMCSMILKRLKTTTSSSVWDLTLDDVVVFKRLRIIEHIVVAEHTVVDDLRLSIEECDPFIDGFAAERALEERVDLTSDYAFGVVAHA